MQAIINVTPGQVLNIYVGGRGHGGTAGCTSCANPAPGWNGGGGGLYAICKAGTGGGATDIRTGTALNTRILVAGGGGGAGNGISYCGGGEGGAGGGLTGGNGNLIACLADQVQNGKGGSQTSGGAGGCIYGNCASAGSLGTGGNAGNYGGNYGGAGGGGYYGGGGSTGNGGAGGGSSYLAAGTLINNVQGYASGDGSVSLTYAVNCPIVRVPVTVSVVPPCTIKSFSPSMAVLAGTTVTIKGASFTGASKVSFGGIPAASYTVVSDTVITAVVANAGASGSVSVTAPRGTATLAGFNFCILQNLSVNISANYSKAICSGTKVSFTATAVNSGTAPQYQWYKNNQKVGNGLNVYTDSLLNNKDSVWLVLTGNAPCIVNNTAKSNVLQMNVNPLPVPVITSKNIINLCQGTTVTLFATIASTSSCQWMVNGTAIKSSNDIKLITGNAGSYTVIETSVYGCAGISAPVVINVNIPVVPAIAISGDTVICQGGYSKLISSATSGNQWNLNGKAIAKSSTSASFVANVTGTYSVTATNSSGCSAVSRGVQVTVKPLPAQPVITEDANLNLVSSATKGNQWFSLSTILPGDTGHVYTPLLNGYYAVQTTQNGCASLLSAEFNYNNPDLNKESLRATGTSTLDSKAVQLYPNPVGSTLKINYQISGIQNVTAEILDMNGNIISRKESVTSGSSIDVSGYASGMYIIRLVNGENKEVLYTTKVMKAK